MTDERMKILIEVPEEELKIYKRDRQIETLYPSDIKKFILSRYYNDIIDATIIPNNVTNGDVIKALFSIQKEKYTDYGTIKVYGLDDEKTPNEFLVEWWNVPYKLSKSKGESE